MATTAECVVAGSGSGKESRRRRSVPRAGLVAALAVTGICGFGSPALAVPATPETCAACRSTADPRACHNVAVERARQGDWARAIAIEEQVHARLPQNAEVAAALARMLHQGPRDLRRATAMYHAALGASPGYAPALLGLGTIMEEQDKREIAARYFGRGARERPDIALFKVRLADVLVTLGRDAEARPLIAEVVERWPGTPEAEEARKLMPRLSLARP